MEGSRGPRSFFEMVSVPIMGIIPATGRVGTMALEHTREQDGALFASERKNTRIHINKDAGHPFSQNKDACHKEPSSQGTET